jgi:uncharacterized protein (DUF1778 family)
MTTLQKQQISARVPSEVYALLKQASHIKGLSFSQFLIQSAMKEALATLESEKITLSKHDAEKVCELINTPPKPNHKLCEAVKLYQQSVLNNA